MNKRYCFLSLIIFAVLLIAGSAQRVLAQSNTVTGLKPNCNVLGNFPVGDYPTGVALGGDDDPFSPSSPFSIWTSNRISNTVTRLEFSTGAPINTFSPISFLPNPGPSDVTVQNEGKPGPIQRIFVANRNVNTVACLNPVSGAILWERTVGIEPVALAWIQGFVWVVNYGSSDMHKLNEMTGAIELGFPKPVGTNPSDIAIDSQGNVYVTSQGLNQVERYFTNGVFNVSAPVGNAPSSVTIGLTRKFVGAALEEAVFVANRGSDTVTSLRTDLALPTLVTYTLPPGSNPSAIAATARGKGGNVENRQVWVANCNNTAARLDPDSPGPTGTVLMVCTMALESPTAVTVHQDVGDAYLTNVKGAPKANAGADQKVCGLKATLNGNAPGVGTGMWTFNGPGAATFVAGATVPNTDVMVSLPGTYTFTWTISSPPCPSSSDEVEITFNPLPTLFTVTGGGSYCAGGVGVPVGLSGSQSGVNYQLKIGGINTGSPIPGTGATISFGNQTIAGVYTVEATITATGCNATMIGSVTVTINPLPTAFTVTGGGAYCAGGTGVPVGLSGSQSGVNYQLKKDGVNTSSPIAGTGSALSFGNQTAIGIYTVEATNSATGCKATMTGSVTVTINPLPTLFTVTGGGSYCAGGVGVPVGLSGSQSGVNYQLKIGGSNTGSPIPGTGAAISFGNQTAAGIYTVEATNPTTGCNATMTGSVTVIINPLPTGFTVTGGGAYCVGGTGVLVGLSGSQLGVNYQLKKDGANTGSPVAGTGSALSFGNQTAIGIYTVEATNLVTGCKAAMTGSVTVTATPNPTPANAGPDQVVCGNSTALAGNTPSVGSGVWSAVPPGSFTDLMNATTTFTGTAGTTYTLRWTISNPPCPASFDEVQVKFNPNPVADFTFVSSGLCVGDKIQFTDASSSAGGAIVSWNWSFGDASPSDIHGGSSTLPNPVYTYAAAGTYTVTLTVTDVNGCKNTKTQTIVVRTLDHVPPFCGFAIDANNNVVITITDQDDAGTGGGIAEINVLINHNGIPVFDRPLVPCVTKYLKINVQPINPAFPANFMFEVKDCCGNVSICDPVFFRAEANGSGRYEFKVSNMDRYLYVQNDGLSKIDIRINNRPLELLADPLRRNLHGNRQYMPWRGDIGVDVISFLTEMENDVVIQVSGPTTASAMIVFADDEFPVTSPAVLPQEFTLLQNYPNPFNPSTRIEYTVPAMFSEGVKVELVIYNIIGQPVKVLENGLKTPNLYGVNWNGTDELGRVVPTGIYLYRIKVGNFTAIKRMSLMK